MEFEESELILNKDGSIFHLNLHPEDISDDIILVGDPGRVEEVAAYFDSIELKKQNREFVTITGHYRGKRITTLSTGIGTDNIDIVLNELDALANINLKQRIKNKEHRRLNLIRIGTSGSLQENIDVGAFLMSEKSIGFDGLLNFYRDRDKVSDQSLKKAFMSHVNWTETLPSPYVVESSQKLIHKLDGKNIIKGATISAPGFYGPQGRQLRLPIVDPEINEKIQSFEFEGQKITNYEMESGGLLGLSQLMGHDAIAICVIIANRSKGAYIQNYKPVVKELIEVVLNRLTDD